MTYCVGLTGNIATGKSTVATIFKQLEIEVISADCIAKQLTTKGQAAYTEIAAHFGSEILAADGQLNRRSLREIIFADKNERLWLENLLHPLIRKGIEEQISLCKSAYCVIEIPLLVDKVNYPYLNKILLITAPLAVQISRIMKRDNCTEEEARRIILQHPHSNLRLEIADDVVVNDGDFGGLRQKVEDLHFKYLGDT